MRTAADTSITICGLWTEFSPPNSSMAETLSSEKRATSCAEAGAADKNTINAQPAEHVSARTWADPFRVADITGEPERLALRVLLHMLHRLLAVRRDARQRSGERADDLGMKLGAGAAPQLAQ